MSEEEMQEKMEFIVNQQAQFAADIQILQESQSELTKKYHQLTDAVITVVGVVGKLAETQERTAREMAEAQKRTDAKFAELAAAHAETGERLNIFISVVERYISERRNGRAREGDNDKPAPPA